jgi:hypothetical protein
MAARAARKAEVEARNKLKRELALAERERKKGHVGTDSSDPTPLKISPKVGSGKK